MQKTVAHYLESSVTLKSKVHSSNLNYDYINIRSKSLGFWGKSKFSVLRQSLVHCFCSPQWPKRSNLESVLDGALIRFWVFQNLNSQKFQNLTPLDPSFHGRRSSLVPFLNLGVIGRLWTWGILVKQDYTRTFSIYFWLGSKRYLKGQWSLLALFTEQNALAYFCC